MRSGHADAITSRLTTSQMLPAVAQGALGIQCRDKDAHIVQMLTQLNHPESFDCIVVEREFLRALDGSCRTPIAGLAMMSGEQINFEGLVASKDGKICMRERFTCQISDAKVMAYQLGSDMKRSYQ